MAYFVPSTSSTMVADDASTILGRGMRWPQGLAACAAVLARVRTCTRSMVAVLCWAVCVGVCGGVCVEVASLPQAGEPNHSRRPQQLLRPPPARGESRTSTAAASVSSQSGSRSSGLARLAPAGPAAFRACGHASWSLWMVAEPSSAVGAPRRASPACLVLSAAPRHGREHPDRSSALPLQAAVFFLCRRNASACTQAPQQGLGMSPEGVAVGAAMIPVSGE
jgi:hypothetical protein